jgi:hypothetical protein
MLVVTGLKRSSTGKGAAATDEDDDDDADVPGSIDD